VSARIRITELAQADREAELAAHLITRVRECGISEDHIPVINLYIALKSKPLVILVGPAESGKQALVQGISQILSGGGYDQYQDLTGHPWWANYKESQAALTELHTRLLTEKLFAILEEAMLPGNRSQIFMACLIHLSPAELLTFFREVAFQLQSGQIMRLGDVHLSAPIPYPSNLFLIGTMDVAKFRWWDDDFLAKATVIHWSGSKASSPVLNGFHSGESEFLRFRTCNRQAAYQKLFAIIRGQKNPVEIIFQIVNLLRQSDISLPVSIMDEIVIYLANAWTANGKGLFDLSVTTNLEIARDLAITQILLPRTSDRLNKTAGLTQQLRMVLGGEFPFSTAFLKDFE